MNKANCNARAIAYEASTIERLRAEGWAGPVETLRQLAELGGKVRKRYENACNYQWATTDFYERGTEAVESQIADLCAASGLRLYLQTDPRGAVVYVCGPSGEMTGRNYSTMGHCLFFADRGEG